MMRRPMKNWMINPKMKRLAWTLLTGLSAVLLYACGHTTELQRFYVLELSGSYDTTWAEPQPLSDANCEIGMPQITQAYANDRIALRTKSHELVYYTARRWAVKPDLAMEQLIEDYLARRHVFRVASARFWKSVPEYRIDTRVHVLEVAELDDDLYAHLSVSFFLEGYEDRRELVYHTSDRMLPLDERNLNSFAGIISMMFSEELRAFTDKIIPVVQSAKDSE